MSASPCDSKNHLKERASIITSSLKRGITQTLIKQPQLQSMLFKKDQKESSSQVEQVLESFSKELNSEVPIANESIKIILKKLATEMSNQFIHQNIMKNIMQTYQDRVQMQIKTSNTSQKDMKKQLSNMGQLQRDVYDIQKMKCSRAALEDFRMHCENIYATQSFIDNTVLQMNQNKIIADQEIERNQSQVKNAFKQIQSLAEMREEILQSK